jgi:hypothetical protein
VDWGNLILAFQLAARGKRGHQEVARFEHGLADRLLRLQEVLKGGIYRPGTYRSFYIHEPKRRRISAAPFRDRVVHHALINVIEPLFEARFIGDSYANRVGKGTHRALDRLQQFSRRYRYVLRMDVVKHFPSIDHEILLGRLRAVVGDQEALSLCRAILASGDGVLDQEYSMVYFPGDDLFAINRPRGLPIGNLTSQFWSNCYMDALDQFVKRELGCPAYLRYVDDLALFSDSKRRLWGWKRAVIERLATLRLTIHEGAAQVQPCAAGIPWLGFLVWPDHRRVKARNVRNATRRLGALYDRYHRGRITFAELDASVQGWINHVRYADTWGLRRHILWDRRLSVDEDCGTFAPGPPDA